jgi:hypothetical protein
MEFDHAHALEALPSHICFSDLLKATPAMEGGERVIYIEASSQARDLQGEVILQKALAEQKDYYLQFGNLDIDHYTQIGRPNAAKGSAGIPDYLFYEIGRPTEVRFERGRTFVKGLIKAGSGPAAEKANLFWSSLTEVNPPERWYPSVGGAVMAKATALDEATGEQYPVITKVRWTNIGFSKTPVNPDLAEVSTVPIGALAKCWTAAGIDLRKSLAAGYATDSAAMSGGDALRAGNGSRAKPDLIPVTDYFRDFRDQFAHMVHTGQAGRNVADYVRTAGQRFQLSPSDASRYVEMFLDDVKRRLKGESQ